MNDREAAAIFVDERDRLFGLAYRMTSSVMDADDVVQETWIKFDRALGRGDVIERPAAFLTTVATRLAIDRMRSAAKKRETYIGPWLPEPILTDQDPAHVVELDESIRLGFLRVLDRLGPVDRAVFVLHDVFGFSYFDVAGVVERSETNCRQIARRARERIRAERPTSIAPSPPSDRALLDALLIAVASGDPAAVEPLLAADASLVSDGGAAVRAARNVVAGPHRVARFLTGVAKRAGAGSSIHTVVVNGGVALAVITDGELDHVWEVEFVDGLVGRIHTCQSPEKLVAARSAWSAGGEWSAIGPG